MRTSPWILAALGAVTCATPANAVALIPVNTQTDVSASATITGPLGIEADIHNGDAHDTSAIADQNGLHVQSAGRSRLETPQTIAANASFAANAFTERDVDAVGQAIQTIKLQAPPGSLNMHFVLPSLLLEISDNVERLGAGGRPMGGDLRATIQVSICIRESGSPGKTCPFELAAILTGNFTEQTLQVHPESLDPGLDLSAFDNQTAVVAGDFFKKTATWEFPSFQGDLDLSSYTGNTFEVEYLLDAYAQGRADITSVAASVNDPFLFNTDPTGGSPLSFDLIAADPTAVVPAPGGFGLLAMALCAFATLRRWRA